MTARTQICGPFLVAARVAAVAMLLGVVLCASTGCLAYFLWEEPIDQWPVENTTFPARYRAPVAVSERWVYYHYRNNAWIAVGGFLRKNQGSGEIETLHLPEGKIVWATDEEIGFDLGARRSIDVYRVSDVLNETSPDRPPQPARREIAYPDDYKTVATASRSAGWGRSSGQEEKAQRPLVTATSFDRLTGRKLTAVLYRPQLPAISPKTTSQDFSSSSAPNPSAPLDVVLLDSAPEETVLLDVSEQTPEHPEPIALASKIECPFRSDDVRGDRLGTLSAHWAPWLVMVWRGDFDLPGLRISLETSRVEPLPTSFAPHRTVSPEEDYFLPPGDVDGWWYWFSERDQDLVLRHPITGEERTLANGLAGVHDESYETPGYAVATGVNILSKVALTPVAVALEPLWWGVAAVVLLFGAPLPIAGTGH
ncbi:MAG: hypothetical protein HY719_12145 [Planctomycetes bacterium]|nr:hypothetical protein [Planctomycetota bacterium]